MTPRPALAAAAVAAAAAILSGCGSSGPAPAARSMSVPAACRYLHLIPGTHGKFPSAAALRYVAGRVGPADGGRAFGAAARRSASDLAAPSLAHIARLGPDFAVVMNGCSPGHPGTAHRVISRYPATPPPPTAP